jgi:hypothetical protein
MLSIPLTEEQSSTPERMQDRQVKLLPFQMQAFDQGGSIEFAIDGEIDCDPARPAKGSKRCEMPADTLAVQAVFLRGE